MICFLKNDSVEKMNETIDNLCSRQRLDLYSTLYVEDTNVEYIPDCVAQLKHVNAIECRNNIHLKRLSPRIGTRLTKLREIYLLGNIRLKTIPSTYTGLTHLRLVDTRQTAFLAPLAQTVVSGREKVAAFLHLAAVEALRPARTVARTLLMVRRFRQSKMNALQLDCMRLICRMVVQDGDAPEWTV